MVRSGSISLNGVNTSMDLNIIPLGSYDILIGMDWLDKHHVVLDFHNKTFTCLDRNGKHSTVKGVPRPISIREILALQLKRCFRKGWQPYVLQRNPLANKWILSWILDPYDQDKKTLLWTLNFLFMKLNYPKKKKEEEKIPFYRHFSLLDPG
jgi:hypothetical protein